MLLYMINDPEETSISKQTFVNPTAFHTLNHTDYIRREREGRMKAVRGDWLHLLLLLTLACLVIVIVRLVVGLYHRRILFRGFPEPIEERHWLFGHLLVVSILCTRYDINLNVFFYYQHHLLASFKCIYLFDVIFVSICLQVNTIWEK